MASAEKGSATELPASAEKGSATELPASAEKGSATELPASAEKGSATELQSSVDTKASSLDTSAQNRLESTVPPKSDALTPSESASTAKSYEGIGTASSQFLNSQIEPVEDAVVPSSGVASRPTEMSLPTDSEDNWTRLCEMVEDKVEVHSSASAVYESVLDGLSQGALISDVSEQLLNLEDVAQGFLTAKLEILELLKEIHVVVMERRNAIDSAAGSTPPPGIPLPGSPEAAAWLTSENNWIRVLLEATHKITSAECAFDEIGNVVRTVHLENILCEMISTLSNLGKVGTKLEETKIELLSSLRETISVAQDTISVYCGKGPGTTESTGSSPPKEVVTSESTGSSPPTSKSSTRHKL